MRLDSRTAAAATFIAFAVAFGAAGAAQQPAAARPKLAVILVVDQMRADYVDRFKDDWTGGLKRLLTQGAWFSRAAYPYLTTVTCAGHATISTGGFPHLHGVFQNAWYDRASGRNVTCTEDASTRGVSYGDGSTGDDSAAKLLLPTFGDEVRAQRGGRVVTLSLKARSAIMLAGRGGDAVTWLSDSLEIFQTSAAFARVPVPAVKGFLAANPIGADLRKVWTRLLPSTRYPGPDDGLGESPAGGWTSSFPHPLADADETEPDDEFYEHWQRSPYADAFLGRMAASLTETLQLGKDEATDLLGVSFSTPDLVGHAFGPQSHEVRDIYARLDVTIGALLDRLDALVGAGEYVVALSSDHGVAEIPEQSQKAGKDAGRHSAQRLTDTIERVIDAAAGPGSYVARVTGNDVYLRPGMYEKLGARSGIAAAVARQLEQQAGILRAFHADELRGGRQTTDPLLRAAALSYVVGRSGDFVIVPKPGWVHGSSATSHGAATPDEQRVPIVLLGRGVKPGEYRDAATPADIAPTLAALVGITMPRAQGTVLQSALTR
jgi:predicted AlkP superfamily pyrophosphatase or phosphodiesterase